MFGVISIATALDWQEQRSCERAPATAKGGLPLVPVQQRLVWQGLRLAMSELLEHGAFATEELFHALRAIELALADDEVRSSVESPGRPNGPATTEAPTLISSFDGGRLWGKVFVLTLRSTD